MDVTSFKEAQERLRKAQADLAHAARLTTMGELAASIAHEVNQPLMAIVTNAESCLLWLTKERPNCEKAREPRSELSRTAIAQVTSSRASVRSCKNPVLKWSHLISTK